MGSDKYEDNVLSGDEIYADSFDDSVEQSAIYDEVLFECIGQKLPAIVLTPQCSIVHPRGELLVTVSGIFPASIVFEEFLQKKGLSEEEIVGSEPIKKKKYEGLSKEFKAYYLVNRVAEFHFLPASKRKLQHSFVDFKVVKTLEGRELGGGQKIAVLKPPWRQSVPSRYAAYSLRIGVNAFADELLTEVIAQISTVNVSQQ
jgi:hypothetical protein